MTRLPGAPWITRGEAPACRARRGTGAGRSARAGHHGWTGDHARPAVRGAGPERAGGRGVQAGPTGATWAADQHSDQRSAPARPLPRSRPGQRLPLSSSNPSRQLPSRPSRSLEQGRNPLLEIRMTPISILSYQGRPIRLRGTMLNLTDMWRAAGCPEYRRPIHWLVLEETARFRAHAQTHWTEPDGPVSPNIIQDDIIRLDPDGFVATARGRHGGTWAHWQLALAYARYLSPEFHLWCNTVVRAALVWPAAGPRRSHDPLWQHLAREFRGLHGRFDTLERHAADLMFLQLSAQELVLGNRLEFTGAGAEHHHQGGGGRALRGPVPLLSARARSHRGRPSGARRRVRPLLPSRPEPAGAWVVDLRGVPCRADPWWLPRPLHADARVPRLPGRRARAPAP